MNDEEWVADHVEFRHLGGLYAGRGILSFDADRGFHLEAFVERDNTPLPESISFLWRTIIPEEAYSSIRLRLQGAYERAFVPAVPLHSRLDVLHQRRLSINLKRVLFFGNLSRKVVHNGRLSFKARFRTSRSLMLPDIVDRDVHIGQLVVQQQRHMGGIEFDSGPMAVRALQMDERELELSGAFDLAQFSRSETWRWPDALRYALVLSTGLFLPLLEREVSLPRVHIKELRKADDVVDLGLLRPCPDDGVVNKAELIDLATFFTRDHRESKLCRSMVDQLVVAARQPSWQARELLVGTILEAALRTLYGVPFEGTKPPRGLVEKLMIRFRDEYLSLGWRTQTKKVVRAFGALRNQNAHPHWLYAPSMITDEEFRARVNDLTLLAWFYGVMIKALAGVRTVRCEPPVPLS